MNEQPLEYDDQRPDFRITIDPSGRINVYHELGRTALVDIQVGNQHKRVAVATDTVTTTLTQLNVQSMLARHARLQGKPPL
jgi:hypothetical protein